MSEPIRRVPCELLDRRVDLAPRPQRVVVLVSGFTEALFAMELGGRVVGVSSYCSRYVKVQERVVVGNYLQVDEERLRRLQPDLILMTSGVQLGVARRLADHGWPVVVLPVPDSMAAIVANILRLGALMGEMGPARRLAEQMMNDLARLQCVATKRLTVYVELWFGRHPRAAGGFGFVQELIHLAGGANIFAERIEGFAKLDLAEVVRQRPEVVVVFWEADDQVVDVPALLQERGWTGRWPFRVVEAGIERGRNLIHDGPSILDTARWLRGQLQ